MTEAGKRLLYDEFGDGLTSDTTDGTIVSRPGVVWERYDRMAAAIAAIEAEATAAAEQRLRDVERLVAACERADIAGELPDELAAALAVLHGLDPSPGSKTASHIRDLDAPPPASPRQGEPVDVEPG